MNRFLDEAECSGRTITLNITANAAFDTEEYQLTVDENKIVFEVFECPAVRHLRKLGLEPSPHLCLQTSEVNAGMCENSPWRSEVKVLGEGHCIQTFTKEG